MSDLPLFEAFSGDSASESELGGVERVTLRGGKLSACFFGLTGLRGDCGAVTGANTGRANVFDASFRVLCLKLAAAFFAACLIGT